MFFEETVGRTKVSLPQELYREVVVCLPVVFDYQNLIEHTHA